MTKLDRAKAQFAALERAYQNYRKEVIKTVAEDKFQEVVKAVGSLTTEEIDIVTDVVTSHK